MNLITLSFTPAAANLIGYAENVTGATWTLTATTANDSLAHLTTIRNDAATDHSAKTALITGTDADGNTQTETQALPGGSLTTTGSKYFKTISSIVPSATIGADTMDLGWSAVAVSQTVPLNYRANPFSCSLGVIVTGTINYTVQHTFQDIYLAFPSTLKWYSQMTLVTATADDDSNYAFPVRGTRLLINSVTAGATIKYIINQGWF